MKIVAIACLILLTACHKNKVIVENCFGENSKDLVCSFENPLEELGWLQELKNQFDLQMGPQKKKIVQYLYNGENVFLVDECFQCADALIHIYDCEKNIVCKIGGIGGVNTCPNFEQNAKDEKILYFN